MNKFKVGDRVRIISNSYVVKDFKLEEGFITKIINNDEETTMYNIELIKFNKLVIKTDEIEQFKRFQFISWFYDCEIELVEESVADQIYKHINGGNKMENKKTTYLAGDLVKKGSIMLRNAEAEELRSIGVNIYSPIEDKSINDKSNISKEDNDKLAERIVKNDTKAIINSDYIIIEPQDNALGTMVELGQLKGMKDAAKMLDDLLYTWQNEGMTNEQLHKEIVDLIHKLNKKVFPHYEDIRRTNIPECGDRRSWGINQYVYGVCLDLSEGKGIYDWDEIVEEMKKIYK